MKEIAALLELSTDDEQLEPDVGGPAGDRERNACAPRPWC
jgi:hypothetical protein